MSSRNNLRHSEGGTRGRCAPHVITQRHNLPMHHRCRTPRLANSPQHQHFQYCHNSAVTKKDATRKPSDATTCRSKTTTTETRNPITLPEHEQPGNTRGPQPADRYKRANTRARTKETSHRAPRPRVLQNSPTNRKPPDLRHHVVPTTSTNSDR